MKKQILLSLAILFLISLAISAQEIPKTISGGVVNGKATSLPKPAYPAAARAVGACGSVTVQVLIDEQGSVISASAVSGHPLLKGSSVQAARQATFNQTRLSGQPVKVSGIIVYVFTCDEEKATDSKETNNSDEPALTLPVTAKESQTANDSGKTISGGVVNGKALSLPKPEYTKEARDADASGTVRVQIVIDEEGNVISAKAVSGHPLLKQVSEQAALKAKFSPTLLAGQPVKVSGVIVYNFASPKPEEHAIWAITAILTVAHIIPGEEWELFTKEDLNDIPELANELEPLISITKTTSRKERSEILNRVTNALQNKLKGEEAWQFQLGKTFGELMVEFLKLNEDPQPALDTFFIKTKLLQINDLILSAPKDFSPVLLKKFSELSNLGKKEEFATDENFIRIGKILLEIFEIVSPSEEDE